MFAKNKHMGHIVLESMKARPDSICQIDAATGEEESNASVVRSAVALARCLRRAGAAPGGVAAISARGHLQLQHAYLAALLDGLPLLGIDPSYKLDEIKTIFKLSEPQIAFCEPESYEDYITAAAELGLDTRVLTFGTGDHSIQELLDTYKDDTPVEEFEIANLDPEKAYIWLVLSAGTSGVVKLAAITHEALMRKLRLLLDLFGKGDASKPHQPALCLSTIQWISGIFNHVSMPIQHFTMIQTSAPVTTEHIVDIINKYKPVTVMLNPGLMTSIMTCEEPCDLTCFRSIVLTGTRVYLDTIQDLKARLNDTTLVMEAYGQTESLGPVLVPNPRGPAGNCGKPMPGLEVKLMDPETGKEITEPNVTGEMLTKGFRCTCYYNDPDETAAAFTEDGWYKTGDLLYRDEDNNYYFVERLKMLIKYRNYQVIPLELEAVVRSHPGVADVSVTSVPHAEDGEHAVACVVPRRTAALTRAEIKELVASKLSHTKLLHGGVVFLEQLPLTPVGKVARAKLRQLVLDMPRE